MFKVNNKDKLSLLTLNILHLYYSVSNVNFEQVNTAWVVLMFSGGIKRDHIITHFEYIITYKYQSRY